ncbi:MTOR-associated protein meak7 [Biomphalaria glabrata]|uniref:MTOR-associated protein MEAK7 n=1 Tax=Biomphalaria glabrata TaxID=6526 RepID=A0A9W3AWI6_BIOGL|nr:MTOR-associated protein MEAK7-like [Biomphalaria glabrata]KAI8759260.1 MTOR-associated protein MEAK7 [Biomphalaria glabrata]KAI8761928.1 MTOR-associated protein MEAK7 [Biomphalaria glabrata]
MGGSESKTTDLKHEIYFSDEEKAKVNHVFCSISHGKKSFNKENLQHFMTPVLDLPISGKLFELIDGPLPHQTHHHHHRLHAHQNHSQEVHLQHFASHLGQLLKGSIADLARTCVFLASSSQNSVSAQDLVKLVTSFLHSYEKLLSAHCTAYQSWIFADAFNSHDQLAVSLLKDLLKSGESNSENSHHTGGVTLTEEAVEGWLNKCSLFSLIMKQVFHGAFQFYQQEPHQITFLPRVPQVRDTNWSRFKTMLDFPTVLFLNFALNAELQSQWKLVFSNSLHGNSFSQLLQHIRNKGPSFIVIKDKDGHVFGGFASVSWEINPKFTGNSSCFLFKVKPFFQIYTSTGYNANFMYLNHQVQTLPNGLGMGGQFEYFGFWIDQSFDRGHSKAGARGNTTFGSPQLSAHTEFQVDCIEVWAVGRLERKEEDEDDDEDATDEAAKAGPRSILDKLASEDKAILDFVDRGTKHDALRDEPIVEETKAHSTIISPF